MDVLPIIDLGSSGEADGVSLTRIVAEVGAASRDVGFFYVVNHGVDPELIVKAFAQSRDFFALPVADKRKLAIETIGGNRGYSGLLHEALDPARGPDMKEAFNVGFELAAGRSGIAGGSAFPLAQRVAWRAGLPRNAAVLLRRVRGARRAIASCVRAATLASAAISSTTNSIGRWRRCGSCTIPRRLTRLRAADGRGRAHGLRQPHAACDRRCRRSRGSHARRTMDRSAGRPRRLRRQYRRLPDALDERRLRFNPASRRQSERAGAVLDRLFLRPQSGRDGRNNSELRAGGRGRALSADPGRRLSDDASQREQAGGGRSGGV